MDYKSLSVKELEKLAKENDVEAIYQLAFKYDYGEDGLELSHEKAFELHKKGAELGHAPSQNDLALCYSDGVGVEQDEEKGFYWYEQAAKNGSEHGMHGLSICYFYQQEFEKAYYWARKSAELGYTHANYILGDMYADGIGTEIDLDKAIQCYKNVHENEAPVAYYSLALLYESQGNSEEAYKWFEKSAELEYVLSMLKLTTIHSLMNPQTQTEDFKKAEKWAEKTLQAEGFDNLGLKEITAVYRTLAYFAALKVEAGIPPHVILEDFHRIESLLYKLIEKGAETSVLQESADLLFLNLGKGYENLKNFNKSFEYFKKSNHLEAAIDLIGISGNVTPSQQSYIFNRLLKTIPNKELSDYHNAAGYYGLGIMLQHGKGTNQNTNEAHQYILKSSNMDYVPAIELLRKYKKKIFGGYEFIG